MCAFTFTVFLSAFQLLPTAPYQILALGGSPFAAGLFLGFLTYASAFSAPVTGALADRVGKRRMLVTCGLVITGFSVAYAVATDYPLMLGLVVLHGVFWSGLLSASAAYITDLIPESRRAEGIGYWGLSTIVAVAFAPAIGFAVYRQGWTWLCAVTAGLNLLMAGIAWSLEEQPRTAAAPRSSRRASSSGACWCCPSRSSCTPSATAGSPASWPSMRTPTMWPPRASSSP
jgi:MFS family permease